MDLLCSSAMQCWPCRRLSNWQHDRKPDVQAIEKYVVAAVIIYSWRNKSHLQKVVNLHFIHLAELVSTYTPARKLRSSSRRPNQLFVPNVRTAFGSRAFRHAAPAVWNGLPSSITDTALSLETFKSRLKTYLYNQSFHCWSCYRSASAIRRLVTTTYDALQTVYYYYHIIVLFSFKCPFNSALSS